MNIKKSFLRLALSLCILSGITTTVFAQEKEESQSVWSTIGSDYSNFYADSDRWMRFGVAFGSMAVVANTSIDQSIQDWYQDDIRSNSTDNFAEFAKVFGEGSYLIPISLLASSINLIADDTWVGYWGAKTARAYLVGTPALLITQRLTGGSRPSDITDKDQNSNWQPIEDENGVSGHSFMGAVPFIVIAKMYDDNVYVKYAAYLGSTLAAWSRINDNQHYTSQSVLGWYLAYESVDSIFDTDKKQGELTFAPMIGQDFYGITVSSTW